MTPPQIIPFDEGDQKLDWLELTQALAAGHKRPRAEIADTFLYRGKDTLLSRSAWIDGLGVLVKTATVFADNPDQGKPLIHGSVSLFDDHDGDLAAYLDFKLVTKWKTAGDSLLGALTLARPDSRKILIIGAGEVARNLRQAYGVGFPNAEFTLWNRTRDKAQALAAQFPNTRVADDLQTAVGQADIITSATMVTEPILIGAWLRPGQHIDLIGAYRPDMREADDDVLRRATIFVDSFDTTVDHIGELKIPLAAGVIRREDIRADFYAPDAMQRRSPDQITLFKNGGGAHLDLMTSAYILQKWSNP